MRAARVVLVLIAVVGARRAAAQSFVEEVSDDPCLAARALEADDVSPAAEHLRRACRIQAFEIRLAAERRQEMGAESQAREARVAAWAESTQPGRALRPVAVEGYLASGISTYGLAVAWNVLRRLELDARLGWRKMTCWDQFSPDGGDCTRTSYGGGARWFLMDKDLSPFVGAGFAITDSHLQIQAPDPQGGSHLVTGNGRAHSVNGGGGFQLSVRGLRMSLEYVYEHVYYAGANLDDMQMTPSADLTAVWQDSLHQDRHGVRFEAGYAF